MVEVHIIYTIKNTRPILTKNDWELKMKQNGYDT